jgi:hypothetical protein
MNAKLEKLLRELELQSERILQVASSLKEEQYNYNPTGKWSVSQILTHIVTAENLSLSYMKKKSLGVDKLDDSGWLESLKIILLKISQRIPVRYKAPKVVVDNTREGLSFEEVSAEWKNMHRDLKNFLHAIPNEYLKRKIYKHPVVGRLDVYQAMQFFREHRNHHWPQIKRLL